LLKAIKGLWVSDLAVVNERKKWRIRERAAASTALEVAQGESGDIS
jgi:hypothetical protein